MGPSLRNWCDANFRRSFPKEWITDRWAIAAYLYNYYRNPRSPHRQMARKMNVCFYDAIKGIKPNSSAVSVEVKNCVDPIRYPA